MSAWAAQLDRMITTVRDTFPAAVVYDPDGEALALTGVFDEAYRSIELGDAGVPVDTTAPRLTLRLADLSATPEPYDILTVDGQEWQVTGVEPDGSGMVGLRLSEVLE